MMMISRSLIILAALNAVVHGQTCPSGDSQQCQFEPNNPHSCGDGYKCGYANICLAETAGFSIENDCCQSPNPAACPLLFDPVECGSKKCPYDNQCIADLAGYSSSQCSTPPPECPSGSKDCSGDPANPYTCGSQRCPYGTICELEDAGWDRSKDCCQDTRGNSACTGAIQPVSCGAPGGKQCVYDSQCFADAAGYNSAQCCPSVPSTTACNSMYEPVDCGHCTYSNQCEADAAGFSSSQCCRHPVTDGCNMSYMPMLCGSASCLYENDCIAEASGHNPNSCVPVPAGMSAETSGAGCKAQAAATVGAFVAAVVAAK